MKINDVQVKTSFTPGILGFANQLFCVWVQDNDNMLYYSLLESNPSAPDQNDPSFFDQRVWQRKLSVRQERASGTPALAALEGVVHLVFPDEHNNLVHLQYLKDPKMGAWGRRTGLLATTSESPCLAAFQGLLWCLYRDRKNDSTYGLFCVCWDPTMGWSKPFEMEGVPDSAGQMALFELNGYLRLLVTDARTKAVKAFVNNGGPKWDAEDAGGLPSDLPSSFGVNATCINNTAFMAYSTQSKVTTKQFSAGKWLKPQQRQYPTMKTPAITILDNDVVCFWPDDNKELQSFTRKALEMPRLDKWMSAIDDSVLASNLTVPGIHDAAALTMFPFAGTQAVPIRSLLSMGIRYIDLRVGYPYQVPLVTSGDNRLCAFHNFVPISDANGGWLTIESIFNDFYSFLDKNPCEGLIVQIKQDRGAQDPTTATKFAADMAALINKTSEKWLVGTNVPTMLSLRKRIQLVRRYTLPVGTNFGIDVSGPEWQDNTTSTITRNGGPRVEIQDRWNLSDTTWTQISSKKFDLVRQYLQKAEADADPSALYLNFASANAVGAGLGPSPIALGCHEIEWENQSPFLGDWYAGVNEKLDAYFNDEVQSPGRYGIVLMDFPQQPEELLAAMIKTNANKFRRA